MRVRLRLGESAEAFEASPSGVRVRLKSGDSIEAGLVLLGIGVRPESHLAALAGLAVGPRGGVRVNEHMQTSDPNIYAVGDVTETQDYVTGETVQIPLAGPANRQGRIAADHIFGRNSRFRGVQGTAIVRLFEVTAAMTGESEKSLKRASRPYRKCYVHPNQHAGYFPGARPMTIKLLFAPENGALLGAQAVGEEGVETRFDVLAVAIQARMSVFDLEEVELAYSPQYGSAKDAINMAGFVAAAVVRDEYPQVQAEDLAGLLSESSGLPPLLLDVRTPAEFAAGNISGALNAPLDELRTRLDELARDRRVIAYCQVGQRGYVATLLLRQAGFDAANLAGGFRTYRLFHPEG
jgi:rhodanese-related sulfurtransferase